jgi:hypothetical protein
MRCRLNLVTCLTFVLVATVLPWPSLARVDWICGQKAGGIVTLTPQGAPCTHEIAAGSHHLYVSWATLPTAAPSSQVVILLSVTETRDRWGGISCSIYAGEKLGCTWYGGTVIDYPFAPPGTMDIGIYAPVPTTICFYTRPVELTGFRGSPECPDASGMDSSQDFFLALESF